MGVIIIVTTGSGVGFCYRHDVGLPELRAK